MSEELFQVPKIKLTHVTHDCKFKSTVVLVPSVAEGYLIGRCGGCKKQVAIKVEEVKQ